MKKDNYRMMHICQFGERMNLHYFKAGRVPHPGIILYDNHRGLFPILFGLQKYQLIEAVPNLIYFDYHDDCVAPRNGSPWKELEEMKARGIEHIALQEVWSFAEWKLGVQNDDWLTAAMDMDLVKDAIVVGAIKNNNIQTLNQRYKKQEIRHHLYEKKHLHEAIESIDCVCCEQWLHQPYILDFDLDAFTTTASDGTHIPWTEEEFYSRYVKNSDVFYLMKLFIENAQLITICREPDFCGGVGGAHQILAYLDVHFFNGDLKTRMPKDSCDGNAIHNQNVNE